jgi:predicted MFS family arabinose efflux permease
VFLVNVLVGLAAMLLIPRLLGRGPERRVRRRLDIGGAALITAAVAALVFAVSEGGAAGWTSPLVLAAAAAAGIAFTAFALAEAHHPDPLVRADLLRLRSLRKGGALIMLLGVWNGGELLVLSLYFQQVLHDSPLMTGLAIAPQGVVGFAAGAAGARLAGRLGLHRLLVLTNVMALLGFLALTRLPATGGYSPLLAAVTFVGFGTAGTAFGAMVTATRGIADGDQGFVGGVINTSRQIGAGIGAALLPAIALTAGHGGPTASVSGDRAAMLAGAVLAGLATLIALSQGRLGQRSAVR